MYLLYVTYNYTVKFIRNIFGSYRDYIAFVIKPLINKLYLKYKKLGRLISEKALIKNTGK